MHLIVVYLLLAAFGTQPRGKALLSAAERGDATAVTRLLAQGAPVNVTQQNGWTPLMLAASLGHDQVARLLLDHGAQVNRRSVAYDYTDALTQAAIQNDVPLVRLLIRHGANVNATDDAGDSIIMQVIGGENALTKQEAIVRLLLRAGARLNVRNDLGDTALSGLEVELRSPYEAPRERPAVHFLKSLGAR